MQIINICSDCNHCHLVGKYQDEKPHLKCGHKRIVLRSRFYSFHGGAIVTIAIIATIVTIAIIATLLSLS